MSLSDRRVQIGSYLGIQPLTHGQIYTFQIAIPNAETIDILLERRELLARTLREHESNLVSLVVRRTQAYDEEKEYEIVYGADWCIVAQELEIERLWVWVFDLTDEQAITMKTELEQLLGGGSIQAITPDLIRQDEQLLEVQLTQQLSKWMELHKRDHEETQAKFKTLSQMISSENTQINNRLQQLENTVNHLTAIVDKLTQLVEKLTVKSTHRDPKYSDMTVLKLKEIARKRKIKGYSKMNKPELIAIISQH
ncbi:hypothetical protein PCC9214_00949 [Planktothrix tepida]|uniref:Rho termination factor-like N-terminal domain-containing protein n=1 Tax=Planktothrix tepida PCC 9214 TaxID=671072 RepID=A0A1J1LF78_9CYAN|nr:Rho termination factor N-terminal domain-containing protein [Planktothrix tepida]CAD5925633.1 hypothetical protein PCC9214_00949 [Planktothrix tepida]CUR31239.1 conserved hypothetical protein [Planktothrix tepida PCC 9214]